MQELIGKTIAEIRLDADEQDWLQFVLTDGSMITYQAMGD
jgi:hypothetical protein